MLDSNQHENKVSVTKMRMLCTGCVIKLDIIKLEIKLLERVSDSTYSEEDGEK